MQNCLIFVLENLTICMFALPLHFFVLYCIKSFTAHVVVLHLLYNAVTLLYVPLIV